MVTSLDTGKSTTFGVEIEFMVAYTVFNAPSQWIPPLEPRFETVPRDHDALVRLYSSMPSFVRS